MALEEKKEQNGCSQLTLESLGDLLEAIYSANTKWYNIGLRLGMKASLLDTISTKYLADPETCLREMLKEWLKGGSSCSLPTWQELVRALSSTAVREKALAGKLRSKYCIKPEAIKISNPAEDEVSQDTETGNLQDCRNYDEGSGSSPDASQKSSIYSTSFSDPQSSDTSRDTSKDSKIRQAFGCGCGKCSLTSFLDQKCPQPIKSLSSFPYLQTTGLNKGEVMILKGRLFNEFQLITRRFSVFNTAICKSLIQQEVTVKTLYRNLRDLRAFEPAESDIPLLRDRFDEIKAASDVDDVFDILADYVSFFSFHITEHLVENLGTPEDKKMLADYKVELEEYCKRNIFECPSYSAPKPGVANLVMKVEGIEKYNLKHLAELISHVSKVISVSQHTLQLCSVERGCVQLNFQIPHFVKDAIFPLGKREERELEKKNIILVKCEQWKYELSQDHQAPHISPSPSTPDQSLLHSSTISRQQSPPTQTPSPSTPSASTRTQPDTTDGSAPDYDTIQAPCGTVMSMASTYSHGAISRLESERRLRGNSKDCFLLRESESRPGCLTLSVKQKGVLNHVLIECTDIGYVPQGEVMPFQTMDSFVAHVSGYLPHCPVPADTDATLTREQSKQPRATVYRDDDDTGNVSDYFTSDDYTGSTGTDWTGDSAIQLGTHRHLHPPPVPPRNTGSWYQSLQRDKLDQEHQYSRVKDVQEQCSAEKGLMSGITGWGSGQDKPLPLTPQQEECTYENLKSQ